MTPTGERLLCQGCEQHPIAITYTTNLPSSQQVIQVSLCWHCWDRFVASYVAYRVRSREARRRQGVAPDQAAIIAKLARASDGQDIGLD
jgi:hypothetical protein